MDLQGFQDVARERSYMKYINIISLIQANGSLEDNDFDNLMNLHGIKLRKGEITDLTKLLDRLEHLPSDINIFDTFYVGYKIPQIGKEFDLLRFSENDIINIELKKTCTEEKAIDQLLRNLYYLNFTGRKVHAFTYVSEHATLYQLDNDQKLIKANFSTLKKILKKQNPNQSENIDDLFDPSDYLVSPFNSTNRFLNNEYFLTHQQEEFRTLILNSLDKPNVAGFISVTGGAGTGKTLLIYDISKELKKRQKKCLIIHCGYLNSGQIKLNSKGWDIVEIKDYHNCNLAGYTTIIIDEAQRIYPKQLEDIIQKVKDACGNCIFSYDKAQILSKQEERTNIDAKINKIEKLTSYRLSEKIRTNKEIADFIKALFNNKKNYPLTNKDNIEINYFNSVEDAKFYLSGLNQGEWEVIRFTPSQYNIEHHEKYFSTTGNTSHQVIGQEFDGVAIPIDQFFGYNENGDLHYRGKAYYHAAKMLFQNITRARKKLKLVIIKNTEILGRCVTILR